MVKKLNLRRFCHVSRSSGLAKTILRSTVKGKRRRVARRRDGKTILKSGQEWTLVADLGQLKTVQGGKGLLQSSPWCSDDLPRSWERLEYIRGLVKHSNG